MRVELPAATITPQQARSTRIPPLLLRGELLVFDQPLRADLLEHGLRQTVARERLLLAERIDGVLHLAGVDVGPGLQGANARIVGLGALHHIEQVGPGIKLCEPDKFLGHAQGEQDAARDAAVRAHGLALDAGAEDFTEDEESYEILTDPESFSDVRLKLEEAGIEMASAEVTMIPQTYVELTKEEDIKNIQKTLDLLEEDDDVQDVYHNWSE